MVRFERNLGWKLMQVKKQDKCYLNKCQCDRYFCLKNKDNIENENGHIKVNLNIEGDQKKIRPIKNTSKLKKASKIEQTQK